MHPKFLKILKCPNTNSDLELKIEKLGERGIIKEGKLISKNNKYVYPIINYIPRFVFDEFYSKSFDLEWKKWPKVQFDSENKNKIMAGYTGKMFKTITEFFDKDLDGKLVLDYGCGSGRFIEIIREKNAIAVGLDMSQAVEQARKNFMYDDKVLIVQGDILNPPFKVKIFDVGFSIGVLHHTANQKRGVKKLVQLIKPNGKVSFCVYPKNGFYNFYSVRTYRKIYKFVKRYFGFKVANGAAFLYSYVSAYFFFYFIKFLKKIFYPISFDWLHKYVLVCVFVPDARWRLLDTFDAITPYYAFTHTSQEVESWLVHANARNIKKTKWCDTSYVGLVN